MASSSPNEVPGGQSNDSPVQGPELGKGPETGRSGHSLSSLASDVCRVLGALRCVACGSRKVAPEEIRLDAIASVSARADPEIAAEADLVFVDVAEVQLVRYFSERCDNSTGRVTRLVGSCKALLLIPAVAIYTLGPWMIPFTDPAGGIWKNHGFMAAHFILNYIAGRTYLELWTRAVERQHRDKFRCMVRLGPLIASCVCALIHVMFHLFGLFPTPFSLVTSCIPAMVVMQQVVQCMMPQELISRDMRVFGKYLYVAWALWSLEIVSLLVWWRSFRYLSAWGQACSTVVMSGGVAAISKVLQIIGDRCFDLPKHLFIQLKLDSIFISFLFSSSVLSQSKNLMAVLVIVSLDAAKAVSVAGMSLAELVVLFRNQASAPAQDFDSKADTQSTQSSACGFWRTGKYMQQYIQQRKEEARGVLQKIRLLVNTVEKMSLCELQEMRITPADSCLYNQLNRSLLLLATVDLCEILVPVIYILMSSALRSDVLGVNREYFLIFASQTDSEFADGIRSNICAVIIECVVFLALQLGVRSSTGLSLWEFACYAIMEDFSFWLRTLSAAYMIWNLALLEHGGFSTLIMWAEGFFFA